MHSDEYKTEGLFNIELNFGENLPRLTYIKGKKLLASVDYLNEQNAGLQEKVLEAKELQQERYQNQWIIRIERRNNSSQINA